MNHQSSLSGKDQSEYSIGKLPLINARALVLAEGLMHRHFYLLAHVKANPAGPPTSSKTACMLRYTGSIRNNLKQSSQISF